MKYKVGDKLKHSKSYTKYKYTIQRIYIIKKESKTHYFLTCKAGSSRLCSRQEIESKQWEIISPLELKVGDFR